MLAVRKPASGAWINTALQHTLILLMVFGNHAKATVVYLEVAGNQILISYYNNSNAVMCHHFH